LLGVGLFVIGLRLYIRISSAGLKGLHADDYLMVVAAASTFTPTAFEPFLTPDTGSLRRRDIPRLFGRCVLERARQQWHDRRATAVAGSKQRGVPHAVSETSVSSGLR
jgi:hypothetical protein